MARITVIGGTGYTGGNIAQVAVARGHEVTSWSRTLPVEPADGVSYETADLTADGVAQRVVANADVVVSALSPRGPLEGALEGVDAALADAASAAGVRLVVIGGFGSLRPAPDAPRIAEGDDFPAAYRAESLEMARILAGLQAREGLDWLYLSPSGGYGAFNPGEATGSYRVGGDVVAPDAGDVSGADFALAVVEEIENAAHTGHISVFG